ncbi:MAG: hypothetical protein ACRC6V_04850 [Bacteroidales bacterium]
MATKVIFDKDERAKVRLSSLQPGDAFELKANLYLKLISNQAARIQGEGLKEFELAFLTPDTMVELLDVEITFSRQ